ncbi:hypothetical protein FA13DRAFT_1810281 [Coprinellus micaceus]|uniref:Uncharacterized protein n=1 Tax=Coprinellus micaceus TaxID=71717 RepID=A0A4Y7TRL8_COPMI|nr:hypothetical protein FA13DRAFT_1810281 [Coprinellus micaceus]
MNPSILSTIPTTSKIHDFFTRHDDKQQNGLITRLDRSPIRQKKVAFFSALALNIVIIICLTILAVLAIRNNLQAPYPPSTRLAFALTQNILLASAVVALLRSTIIPFFLGECRLRYLYGFQEAELAIRRAPRSRSLDLRNITNLSGDSKAPKLTGSALVPLCYAAQNLVDMKLVYYRPGALFSSNYWTPEYSAMLDAYNCLGAGQLAEVDFDFAVWKQADGAWTVCELWRLQEMAHDATAVSTAEAAIIILRSFMDLDAFTSRELSDAL